MQIRDSDPGENPLLRDVEFSDDQIVQAMIRPIQFFNEAPPPLSRRFDSRNFPWKTAWLDAAAGYLYQYAAAYYRRNRLAVVGGGKTLDALNREAEYLRMSKEHLDRWQFFVTQKKMEINMRACIGVVGSDYGLEWSGNGGLGGMWR
jgi:hypothetical protein